MTPLIDDGYYDEPVPVHEPVPQRRGGCVSVLPYLVVAVLILIAAPRSAANDIPVIGVSAGHGSFEGPMSGNLSPRSGAPQFVTGPVESYPGGRKATLGGTPTLSPSPAAAPQSEAGTSSGAPQPSGEVGTALVGGWATYYATCAECAAAGPLLQAAFGPDWQGRWVTVESRHGKALLRLVTSCACGDRKGRPTVIDVSREAFGELSPYPAGSDQDPGYVRVSIEIPSLPATDADVRMQLEVRDDEVYR